MYNSLKGGVAVNRQLGALPKGGLNIYFRDGKENYFISNTVDGKRIRKIINKNPKLIQQLAMKKFLEAKLPILKKNLAATKIFAEQIEDDSTDYVLGKLPKWMQALVFKEFEAEVDKEKLSWEKQPYNMSDYMPERKTHTTSRGLKVRSKSEVLICEAFYRNNIAFRYEQILEINGISFIPDFTIRRDDGKMVFWEHAGRTDNKDYINKHFRKMLTYIENGLTPWNNLIVTYDDEEGNINMNIIESEIALKLK